MVAVFVIASMPVSAGADVISAGGYKALGNTLNQGDTWYFSVQAEDGVDILVMDEDNYQVFKNGGTPFTYTEYTHNSMSQVSFTIDDLTGEIWIVVRSTNLLFDQTINYESSITRYVVDDGGEETPGFTFPIMISALFIGVGIVTVARRYKRN